MSAEGRSIGSRGESWGAAIALYGQLGADPPALPSESTLLADAISRLPGDRVPRAGGDVDLESVPEVVLSEGGPSTRGRTVCGADASAMFVRYYVEIGVPFDLAEQAMLDDPKAWIPAIAQGAESRGDRLLADVGFGQRVRLNKRVEVVLGAPRRLDGKMLLPMTWTPGHPDRLFPRLEADVEIRAFGVSRVQLAISARYHPPMGLVGRAIDRTMLHLVAEATIKDFLDGVAENLRLQVSVPAE